MGELIDSSVLITLERRGGDLRALAAAQPPDERLSISAVTVSELLTDLYLADTAERRERRRAFIERLLDEADVLPFDLSVAKVHAPVWAQLKAAGQLIGAHDLLIAATALAHGYAVVTANLREFERVPGLVVRRFP